jgi:DNA helicase INO80
MLDSKTKVENLMNLVMQFRKICNHPELFERKPFKSPYTFLPHRRVVIHQQVLG